MPTPSRVKPPLTVNQPIAPLDAAERLGVRCMRVWVRAIKQGGCPNAALLGDLASYDMVDAATPLHHLMCFVGSQARIAMDVRCPHCTHLGDGERRLIGLLAAAQGGDDQAFTRQAAEIFRAEVLVGAAVVARRVAGQFLVKGLAFPTRPMPSWAPEVITHTPPETISATVH